MNRHSDNPLRLFVDPFAAWRELALKTGEMIVASAWAGAARASAARVAVIDQREPLPPPAAPQSAISREAKPAIARKVKTSSTSVTPKARGTKKHKKRAKRR